MVFAHGYIPLSPCQQRFPFSNHEGGGRVGYSCRCPDSKEVAQELTYQEAEISNGKIHVAKLGHGVRQMDAYFFCMHPGSLTLLLSITFWFSWSHQLLVIDSSWKVTSGMETARVIKEESLWATICIADTERGAYLRASNISLSSLCYQVTPCMPSKSQSVV